MTKLIRFKIKRQDHPEADSYWEVFEVTDQPNLTVHGALKAIQRKSINIDNRAVSPVVWAESCLTGVGRLPILINGKIGFPHEIDVASLDQPVCLEPLSKFKVLRDLLIDRSAIYKNLTETHSILSLDGLYPTQPLVDRKIATDPLQLELSKCTSCGACLEACPQYSSHSKYRGAFVIPQSHRLNLHPNGQARKDSRLAMFLEAGGVDDCGNAQSCQQACPQGITLVDALGSVKKQTFRFATSHF